MKRKSHYEGLRGLASLVHLIRENQDAHSQIQIAGVIAKIAELLAEIEPYFDTHPELQEVQIWWHENFEEYTERGRLSMIRLGMIGVEEAYGAYAYLARHQANGHLKVELLATGEFGITGTGDMDKLSIWDGRRKSTSPRYSTTTVPLWYRCQVDKLVESLERVLERATAVKK